MRKSKYVVPPQAVGVRFNPTTLEVGIGVPECFPAFFLQATGSESSTGKISLESAAEVSQLSCEVIFSEISVLLKGL